MNASFQFVQGRDVCGNTWSIGWTLHVIGIWRLPIASGWSPNASALLEGMPLSGAPLKHHHLSFSHSTILKFSGPSGFDASVSLLMGLLVLECSCLHLAYSAEASSCSWASFILSLFSSCASFCQHSQYSLDFLFIHCIISVRVPLGNRCLSEGDNWKDLQRCRQS